MTRGHIIIAALTTAQTLVDLMQGRVHIDQCINNSCAMERWHRKLAISDWKMSGWIIRRQVKVKGMSEFHANLVEGLIGPITKPIEDTTVEQCWRGCGPRCQTVLGGFMVNTT